MSQTEIFFFQVKVLKIRPVLFFLRFCIGKERKNEI